ncbi:MAG: class I SAM-dependent methyltransferase [Salinibacter sp.]|uniref:class I SAM-dependent methyltransferase n=1 Tax=Salinibacter sp. TaxID=2065818 RepID=UPI0035D4191D
MRSFPTPRPVTAKADVQAFFDDLARHYAERHGPAEALRRHRLRVLARHAQFGASDVVLDVGCGDGAHLRALADRIDHGLGIDLSPQMVQAARDQAQHPSLTFRVGDAERLASVPDASVDAVLCVGVLEHLLHPARALRQIARVLKPSGRVVALTLNGDHWWYRLADRLGVPTRHLATDRRLSPARARRLLRKSGLRPDIGFWRFVPSGDLPRPLSALCRALDQLGQRVAPSALRGGLRLVGRPA